MKFIDTAFDQKKRYSIGRETESGRCFLSIPVSNRLVEYEEYYEIAAEWHDSYPSSKALLERFADECRERFHDDLLLVQPGRDRGVAT